MTEIGEVVVNILGTIFQLFGTIFKGFETIFLAFETKIVPSTKKLSRVLKKLSRVLKKLSRVFKNCPEWQDNMLMGQWSSTLKISIDKNQFVCVVRPAWFSDGQQ